MKLKERSDTNIFFKGITKNNLFKSIIIILIILIFLKILTFNKQEIFLGGAYLFEIIIQLFLASFISIIFYVILIFMPLYKNAYFVYGHYELLSIELILNLYEIEIKNIQEIENFDNLSLDELIEKYKTTYISDTNKLRNYINSSKIIYDFIQEESLENIKEIDKTLYKKLRYIRVHFKKLLNDDYEEFCFNSLISQVHMFIKSNSKNIKLIKEEIIRIKQKEIEVRREEAEH